MLFYVDIAPITMKRKEMLLIRFLLRAVKCQGILNGNGECVVTDVWESINIY